MASYVPKPGDIVWLNFHPQSGHEQKGHRPAFVISKELFNKSTGLAMVCPITTTDKEYPFHIATEGCKKTTGWVMVEQLKSVDYHSRRIKFKEKAPKELLSEVLSILDACLY